MTTLARIDPESLSEVLLEIYAADGIDDFRSRTLKVVHRLFGGELACHNEINLVNGDSLSVLSQPSSNFEAIRPAFFDHVEQHPSIQHHIAANGGETQAVKTSDFVSQRRWRNSGLYADFYKPLADVRFQLTIGQKIEDWLVFFAVSRRDRDFSEHERAILTSLRPHFIQAYRNAKTRTDLQHLRRQHSNGGSNGRGNGQVADALSGDAAVFALMQRFGLSRREAQVLGLIGDGKTNAEIADALHISVSTVKTRLESVYEKLNVNSRTAAALRVLKENTGAE